MHRRQFVAACGALALNPKLVNAQAWPNKPIRFVVPYIPGSAPDVLARSISERLSSALGQSLVIENRPGAGSNIGNEAIAKASADGYTIGLGTSAMTTNPSLYRKVNYEPVADFVGINLCVTMPHLLVVAADSPIKNVADLIRLFKEGPGKYNYASGGNGSGAHLAAELFKTLANVDVVHVPYKGAPEIITSVISKAAVCGFPTLSTAVPLVKSGRLRALGVTGTKRNHALPEVPSIGDTVAGFDYGSWFGLIAPAKTPSEVVQRLDAELQKAFADKVFRDKVQADGTEVVSMGHAEFTTFIRNDMVKMKRIVEMSGARID